MNLSGTSEADEKDADDFARETLIPSEMLTPFVQDGIFTSDTLIQFAERLGIEVGILVGRLQHDGFIKCSRFNDLKKKYEFS